MSTEIFVGEHGGIELFTIGQRKGLPGGSPRPRYVVDLDPATNRVIVGDADDLVCEEFEIDRVNWHPARARGSESTPAQRRSHGSTAFEAHGQDSLQSSRDACDSDAIGERSRPRATARTATRRNAGTSCSYLRR